MKEFLLSARKVLFCLRDETERLGAGIFSKTVQYAYFQLQKPDNKYDISQVTPPIFFLS
jgi:hypothetical protein